METDTRTGQDQPEVKTPVMMNRIYMSLYTVMSKIIEACEIKIK